jgi:hypothetical protein
MCLLVQGVRGGGAGAGEPVQADRGEQLVAVDRQVVPLVAFSAIQAICSSGESASP